MYLKRNRSLTNPTSFCSCDLFFFLPPSSFRASFFALLRSFLCFFSTFLFLVCRSCLDFGFNQELPALSIERMIRHTSKIISSSDHSSKDPSQFSTFPAVPCTVRGPTWGAPAFSEASLGY